MKKQVIIIVSVLALILASTITVFAAYDSSEDPLISLSYLNDIFKKEILEEIEKKFDDLALEIRDALENIEIPDTPSNPPSTTDQSAGYVWEVIELKTGDELYAVSACDIILRAGTAVAIAPDANQGVADLQNGAELLNGYGFTKNHLCLIPRGDGRGLRATSASVFVMIRGEYTIVKN
ncbi:MAG: hypothetical protein E7627_02190 [Ruminococcaceae bacterium]|nr:hypothetical protein [Oscillospiraceae bacterium]